MGLTGSQLAYRPARAGLARSGATRCGYFSTHNGAATYNVVTTINGVDRSSAILAGSMQCTPGFNDTPASASFTMKPGVTIPTPFETVLISFGNVTNRVFGGQAITVKHRRRPGNTAPWVDVTCTDWARLFNRRLVTAEFTAMSATDIILAIVSTYTSGFTTVHVQAGLPTLDYVQFTNEEPLACIRRLITLIGGGGCYLDPFKDLHVFDTTYDTSRTAPTTLTNNLSTLKRNGEVGFRHAYEGSQFRNRVTVEGNSGATLVFCPAAVADPDLTGFGDFGLPVSNSWLFNPGGGSARIGRTRYEYTQPVRVTEPVYVVTDAPALAGATSVSVYSNAAFEAHDSNLNGIHHGWGHPGGDDQNMFAFEALLGSPTLLSGIPPTGYGALAVDIPADTAIYLSGSLHNLSIGGIASTEDIESGEAVAVVEIANDSASQSALALIEDGDGIHEHFISDSKLNYVSAAERAQAELDAFADEAGLLVAEWETRDTNAWPGVPQVINLTVTDALSATLPITDVSLTFDLPNSPPLRSCKAQLVRLAEVADLIADAPHS